MHHSSAVITVTCLICDRPIAHSRAVSLKIEDQYYLFCSDFCREEFEENLTEYLRDV
jgi:YHS domain-containing protein